MTTTTVQTPTGAAETMGPQHGAAAPPPRTERLRTRAGAERETVDCKARPGDRAYLAHGHRKELAKRLPTHRPSR